MWIALNSLSIEISPECGNDCPNSLCVGQLCRQALPALLKHLALGVDQLDAVVALGVVRGGDHHADGSWEMTFVLGNT